MLALLSPILAAFGIGLRQLFGYLLIALMVLAAVFGLYWLVRENALLRRAKEENDQSIHMIRKNRRIEREMEQAPEDVIDKWAKYGGPRRTKK